METVMAAMLSRPEARPKKPTYRNLEMRISTLPAEVERVVSHVCLSRSPAKASTAG